MASIRRKIFTFWVLPNGQRVPANTPGAKKQTQKSQDFYGFWTNEAGREQQIRFKNCRDRKAAQILLADHLKRLAREAAGLDIPLPDRLPYQEHLRSYVQELQARKRNDEYIGKIRRHVDFLMAKLKLIYLEDVKAAEVRALLLGKDVSARTRDSMRQSLSYFLNWCASPSIGRLVVNPLRTLPAFKGSKVRERRALNAADLQKLLDAARRRPLANFLQLSGAKKGKDGKKAMHTSPEYLEKLRIAGWQRALLYKFAMLTASRYGAICSLTVAALSLNGPQPKALFASEQVKGKRSVEKPLPPTLVADLKEWIAFTGKQPIDRVFGYSQASVTRELKKDMEFAGIPYKDAAGRTFDFHAFKKSAITALAAAKVDVRLVQEFAEHRDIRLTLEVYNDVRDRPMNELFDALPAVE